MKVRFVYVTEGIERTWSPDGDDLAAIESELVELTDRVSSDEVFEARPDPMRCRWCSYASLCPARDETSMEDLGDAATRCSEQYLPQPSESYCGVWKSPPQSFQTPRSAFSARCSACLKGLTFSKGLCW